MVPANVTHSRDIWRWRNDALTRRMSASDQPISWETHQHWFEQCLLDECRRLYVGSLPNKCVNVGICRFDVDDDAASAVVSLSLCSRARGKGLSSTLLGMSIRALETQTTRTLYATIRKENVPSVRCFSACGFRPISCDEDFIQYVREGPGYVPPEGSGSRG